MKKFYSFVLMATMLLVGTNVWADPIEVSSAEEFAAALGTASPVSIKLTDNIPAAAAISATGGKIIEIDLNGYNITSSISVNNGQLSLQNTATTGAVFTTSSLVGMTGSYDDVANYSVLTVGEGVTIDVTAQWGVCLFQNSTTNPVTKKADHGYGMVFNLAGTINVPNGNGVWVLGNIKTTAGTNHSRINVLPTGVIIGGTAVTPVIGSSTGDAIQKQVAAQVGEGAPYGYCSCGIYAGGYCISNIQGSVSGGNGIYIKGGKVNVNGGTITALATEYWRPLFYGNGMIASGSAIVLDNNAGYCDDLSLNVTGNAVVTSETGCAIEELVTSGTEKMGAEDFVIESGTFTSGTDQNSTSHAAVTVTTELGTEVKNEGTVSGGMFSTPVDEVLSVTGETTEIVVDGQTYQVIHEEVNPAKTLANSTIADGVKMDATTYTVASDATAKASYLELKNGATVTVEGTLVIGDEGVVVTGATSKLTVKAGGKLVINSGIITDNVDQLIVEANETNSGVLVAAPGVSWNAQPLATVQFYTFAKQYSATNNVWQRIATPLSHYDAISNDFTGATQDGAAFTTWVQKWNGNGWEYMSAWADLKAFTGYALSNNSINGGVTYSFKGNIQGGVTSDLKFISDGLNFFGNSYTAPIQIAAMLPKMTAKGANDAIYIWDAEHQRYEFGSTFYIGLIDGIPTEIPATQTFVLNHPAGASVAPIDMDYANSVWAQYASLATTTPSPIVKRAMPTNLTFVQINIAGADGDADKVILTEGEQFSAEFDNGADIVKYVEPNHMNVYVAGAEIYAAVADNDILGTMLTIQTQNNVNYTMSFSNVRGEGYAIKDMMTGAIINMEEGNEYSFVAQANATTEGRFQIVDRNNAPTAIDNTEVKSNVKGIYTITGQYVGENYDALPAGVYVVDGVKIVK